MTMSEHRPVKDSSLINLDVDPFWRCSCGGPWPCPEGRPAHDAEAARERWYYDTANPDGFHNTPEPQAARVLPSVEDVATVLAEHFCEYSARFVECRCGWVAHPTSIEQVEPAALAHQAAAILAVLADSPSREQVEREAAEKALRDTVAELESLMTTDGPGNQNTPYGLAGRDIIARIAARAERLAAGGKA